ncbi:hypothetical protein KFK09_026225 [Dendrobium nobile]|uniref:Endonuclease/exonuclease/phosphatase domain-containing protein n=1 Tax=Dendrobium nobile TaxID=94219 RepID=A0A8T3A837_DENNO|nr:hypothetical protein KFK09_026225 [Dendrobium nobile]
MILPSIASWNIRGFNNPSKVIACKHLIKAHKLDLICILENRIHLNSMDDPWFTTAHKVFDSEVSYNNFNLSASGRIWIKWAGDRISFALTFFSSQLICGFVSYGPAMSFFISAVYGSNYVDERLLFWQKLRSNSPSPDIPWIIMGDFNCCRFQNEKAEGSPLHFSRMGDFYSFIFDNQLIGLSSTGLFYTWFNHQIENSIHIKLDRALVNEAWIAKYSLSYYFVDKPLCSDHSPIVLKNGSSKPISNCFQFKKFWTSKDEYWCIIFYIFLEPIMGNPLMDFSNKLRKLKASIKTKEWASTNAIQLSLHSLLEKQQALLNILDCDPTNPTLNVVLKETNGDIAVLTTSWTSWVSQRAKAKWLKDGEDDLKFLYSKIHMRKSFNSAALHIAMCDNSGNSDNAKQKSYCPFSRPV